MKTADNFYHINHKVNLLTQHSIRSKYIDTNDVYSQMNTNDKWNGE